MMGFKTGIRFEELDALRGIAALMVVLFHFTMFREQAALGFKLGVTGVDLFFMISGFVIYMSLNRVKTSAEFIINRLSRLYPTYWACVTLTFLSYLVIDFFVKHHVYPLSFYMLYLANMTMFQFYLGQPDLDGPYWTMIIEMIFYISVLLLFRFRLLGKLTSIGMVLILLTLAAIYFFYEYPGVRFLIKWIPLLSFTPLFLAGTLFYKIYTQKNQLVLRYGTIVFCMLSQIALFGYGGTSSGHINKTEYALMLLVYFGVFALFVNHKLHFIVSKPTLFLGKISFALYLIHQHIGIGIIIPFFTTRLHLHFWIGATIALVCVIAIAAFITYYIDIPYGKKFKEKLRILLLQQTKAIATE